jgi:colicin import membrane protein
MQDTAVDLVPLKIDFDIVLRGYDRDQVQYYVQAAERDTQLLTADRDAALSQVEDLAGQLEAARATNRELRNTIDRISRTPIDTTALSERLRRMVELATAEAHDTTRRAQAAAEATWRQAEDTAARLTQRHRELLTELDERRRAMESEHADLIRRAQADVDRMTREAQQRRTELDQRAEELRTQAQTDFDLAMAARRAELDADLAQRRARADADFARHIGALRDEVRQLRELRDAVRGQLLGAQRLLADLLPDLEADEQQAHLAESVPRPRSQSVGDLPACPPLDQPSGRRGDAGGAPRVGVSVEDRGVRGGTPEPPVLAGASR